ncbi:MAG: hypothetical protein WBE18_01190 [Gammaproteobacteria bacterium]
MQSNRSQLIKFLADKRIKKILIAEGHLEKTAKDLLIDNMDLFLDPEKTGGRKVVIVLEHLSVRKLPEIDAAIAQRKFTKALKNTFDWLTYCVIEENINKLTKLAAMAICNGISVIGAENEKTNYSSLLQIT